jgi:hypothetical protein
MEPIWAKFLVENLLILGVAAAWYVLRSRMEEVAFRYGRSLRM